MSKRNSEAFYDPDYDFDEYGLLREVATNNILVFCRRTEQPYVLPGTLIVTRPLIEENIHCARYGDVEPVHVILPPDIASHASIIDARTWINMRNV